MGEVVTYKRPPRPTNAYDAGKHAVSGLWGTDRPTAWLHAQLRQIGRLPPTEYQRGRRDAILDELRKRGVTPQ
jgi:hypothetical protein